MVAPLPGPSSKNTSSLSAGPVHEGGNPLPNGSNGDSKTKEKTALLEMSSRSGVWAKEVSGRVKQKNSFFPVTQPTYNLAVWGGGVCVILNDNILLG